MEAAGLPVSLLETRHVIRHLAQHGGALAQLQHPAPVGQHLGSGLLGSCLALGGDLKEHLALESRRDASSPNSVQPSMPTSRSRMTARRAPGGGRLHWWLVDANAGRTGDGLAYADMTDTAVVGTYRR